MVICARLGAQRVDITRQAARWLFFFSLNELLRASGKCLDALETLHKEQRERRLPVRRSMARQARINRTVLQPAWQRGMMGSNNHIITDLVGASASSDDWGIKGEQSSHAGRPAVNGSLSRTCANI